MTRRTKKRLFVVLVALVLLPAIVAGAWAVRSAQQKRLLESAREQGMAAYEAGDLPVALRRLGYYIARRKDDGEALLAYARAQELTPSLNDRNLVQAVTANRLALGVLPDDPRPLEGLIRVYMRMGFVGEMLDAAEQALALDPENEEGLRAKTSALFALGRPREAAESATFALERLGPRGWSLAVLAEAYLDADEMEEGIGWFEGYVAEHPGSLDAALALARLQFAASRPEEGLLTLEAAAQIEPEDEGQLRRLLGILDGAGMDDLAVTALESAPARVAALIAVERAWKQGRTGDASRAIADARGSMEEPPLDLLGYGAMLSQTEDSPAPDGELLAAIESSTAPRRAVWTALLRGREQSLAGNESDALAQHRDALGIASSLADPASLAHVAMHHLALTQAALGNHIEAVRVWRRVLESDPSWRICRVALVEELLRTDRTQEALVEAVSLAQRAPRDPLAAVTYLETIARLLEDGAQIPLDSRATLRSAMDALRSAAPENAALLALAARIQLASGEIEQAKETIGALAQAKNDAPTTGLIRLAASTQRRAPELYPQIASLVEQRDPGSAALAFSEAIAVARDSGLEAGLRVLDEAMVGVGEENRLQLMRARARFLQSIDQRRAAEEMRQVADEFPKSVPAQTDLLSNPVAWEEQAGVTRALTRLATLVGQDAAIWKLYEAQRKIAFERSDPNAVGASLISLSELIRAEPLWAEARLLAAEADLLLGDRDAAIESLEQYLDAGGREASVYLRIIPLLREAGRADAARAAVGDFASIESLPDRELMARAGLLERWGDLGQALRDYQEAARLGSLSADAAVIRIRLAMGDIAGAQEVVDRLAAREELPLEGHRAIARYHAERGDLDQAIEVLYAIPDDVASADERSIAAALLLNAYDRRDEAVALLVERTASGAGPEVWGRLAALRMDAFEFAEALDAAKAGLEAHPDDPGLTLLRSLASLALESGDPGAALEGVNEALAAADTRPEVRELGLILGRRAQSAIGLEQYIADLSRLTAEHPTLLPAWRPLVNAQLEAGRPLEAAGTARAAAAAMPDDPRILELATRTLAMTDQLSEALVFARAWRSRRPDDDAAAMVVAELLVALGQPAEAIESLGPVAEGLADGRQPDPAALALYATALAQVGRTDEAWDLLAERAQGDEAWTQRLIATEAGLRERPRQSRDWLARSESLAADSPRLMLALGEQWAGLAVTTGEQADYERAIEILRKAVDAQPSAASVVALAIAQEASGDFTSAEASYRRALELAENPVAMNNLAQLLVRTDGSLSEARSLAEQAVSIVRSGGAPDGVVAAFLDTLANVELKAGRHESARATYREALALAPTMPDSLIGLAEASLAVGDAVVATDAARRARDAGADLAPHLAERLARVEAQLSQIDN